MLTRIPSSLAYYGTARLAKCSDAACVGRLALYTSAPLLAELAEVLPRPKLARRLAIAEVTPQTFVVGYAMLAQLIVPATIGPVVEVDPDDDAVLACAVAAHAEVMVSGDSDFLDLESYEGIPIITAPPLKRSTPRGTRVVLGDEARGASRPRDGFYAGTSHRLLIRVVATEGNSLEVNASVFVTDDHWQHGKFLGYSGVLERLSFVVDPGTNSWYCGLREP